MRWISILQPRSQRRAFDAQHRCCPSITLVRFPGVPSQRLQNVFGSHKRGQTFRKSWWRHRSSGNANDSGSSSSPFLLFLLLLDELAKYLVPELGQQPFSKMFMLDVLR